MTTPFAKRLFFTAHARGIAALNSLRQANKTKPSRAIDDILRRLRVELDGLQEERIWWLPTPSLSPRTFAGKRVLLRVELEDTDTDQQLVIWATVGGTSHALIDVNNFSWEGATNTADAILYQATNTRSVSEGGGLIVESACLETPPSQKITSRSTEGMADAILELLHTAISPLVTADRYDHRLDGYEVK